MKSGFLDIGSFYNNKSTILLLFYVLLALCFSIFYGLKSIEIFVDEFRAYNKRKMRTSSWEFHMFWVNFVSSLLGWVILFYLVTVRFALVKSIFLVAISLDDIILIFTAVLGVTGVLGHLLSKISSVK